jgi:hypothetical protein
LNKESEDDIRLLNTREHVPIEFNSLLLEQKPKTPSDSLNCTKTITPTKSGHPEVPGKSHRSYNKNLLKGYDIKPWTTTKVRTRDLGRAKCNIRKAAKWREGKRKRHDHDAENATYRKKPTTKQTNKSNLITTELDRSPQKVPATDWKHTACR